MYDPLFISFTGRDFPARYFFAYFDEGGVLVKQTVFEITQSFRSASEEVRREMVQEKIDRYLKRRMEHA